MIRVRRTQSIYFPTVISYGNFLCYSVIHFQFFIKRMKASPKSHRASFLFYKHSLSIYLFRFTPRRLDVLVGAVYVHTCLGFFSHKL